MQAKTVYLKDYQEADFLVEQIDLNFDLQPEKTLVRATSIFMRNPLSQQQHAPLVLDGEDLNLISIKLDGEILSPEHYQLNESSLTILHVADKFTLEVTNSINPQANTKLSGLYISNNNFCTQCEALGFRRITYFLDRPDVLTKFKTTIQADKNRYPVMLSNGNLIDQGDLANNRHYVTWEDPFKKPCYLFALVAGSLQYIKDTFTTLSGREIDLRIYVEQHNINKCQHAMFSLKQSMKWDEETYGREYDLDIFMIVAVEDFNFGAMENKGLNIFNAKYILADADIATDQDYERILEVVGHEYFHNWSGNRVTCRDWFQLSLKEGLTVFRDQTFTSDITASVIKRIDDVNILRSYQFAEDIGPNAHPVRTDHYIAIDNFYTVTVYNKGAEVVRMFRTILGQQQFRAAMDYYFEKNDGYAVTIEDFVDAMHHVCAIDFKQFMNWYNQSGTPIVHVSTEYDAAKCQYILNMRQTLDKPDKKPHHIPIAIGLLNSDGDDLPLKLAEGNFSGSQSVLNLTQLQQQFIFTDITEEPVPSLLRDFSAPVKLEIDYSNEQLQFLIQHDNDRFNRWDAWQRLASQVILQLIAVSQQGSPLEIPDYFYNTFARVLEDDSIDDSSKSVLLTLPSIKYLSGLMDEIDIDNLYVVHSFIKQALAKKFDRQWLAIYQQYNNHNGDYQTDNNSIGIRRIKNTALAYLLNLDEKYLDLAVQQSQQANNLTDRMAALTALSHTETAERNQAIAAFYQQWHAETLLMDKWLSLQALSEIPDVLNQVKQLLNHKVFNLHNPNKVRALIGAFANNYSAFHAISGKGYEFISEQVLVVDKLNPNVAASLVQHLTFWRRYDQQRQMLMKACLKKILGQANLSKNVYEMVDKSLKQ